jgi:hypothetical protein
LKIYKFPKNFTVKWHVYFNEKEFTSWYQSCSYDLEWVKSYISKKTKGTLISEFLDRDFGKLAQEVVDGKWEEYLVWSDEAGEAIDSECQCPSSCFLSSGHLSNCPLKPKPPKYTYM